MKKRMIFLSGTGLVSLHLIDTALVDVEPGASLARHLPWLVATLGIAAAAALSYRRLPRELRAAVAGIFGALAASDAAQHVKFVHDDRSITGLLLVPAAALLFAAAASEAWGVNRAAPRVRAWARRLIGTVAVAFGALFVVVPLAAAVYVTHKPRRDEGRPNLGAPYRDVYFAATDGTRIHAWYIPARNGAVIAVMHGSGGDAAGPRRQVRLLVSHGFGVLDIDARGRGRSDGDQDGFGWHWDRDIRGGVTWLRAQHVAHIGAFGLSTGAEAVLQATAEDARIEAVVADGAQGRETADLARWHGGVESALSLASLAPVLEAYRLLTWSAAPPRLQTYLPRIAPRPVLLVSTGTSYERALDRLYLADAHAPKSLLELPDAGHTRGLQLRPRLYASRVLAAFAGLCPNGCG